MLIQNDIKDFVRSITRDNKKKQKEKKYRKIKVLIGVEKGRKESSLGSKTKRGW